MTADCDSARLLLQAELDGELDAGGAVTLAAHLAGCADCTAQRERLTALSARMAHLPRFAAPARLRSAVLASLPPVPRRRRWSWEHGAAFGAGLALAAALAAFIVLPAQRDAGPDVIAAHLRALQPGHLMDVASTDQHTVKPWFAGRLDYSPPVRDLAAEGFPLIGGRLDYVGGREVAVLVYSRNRHLIDVFIWPGAGDNGTLQRRGFNVVSWSRQGMAFQAVSDLNGAELADFAEKLRGAP